MGKCIFELDGPPLAYFEVTDGHSMVRRAYRTLRASSDEVMADNIEKLKQALPDGALVFWRKRYVTGDPYCRLITSPPLLDDLWLACGWDSSGTGVTPP